MVMLMLKSFYFIHIVVVLTSVGKVSQYSNQYKDTCHNVKYSHYAVNTECPLASETGKRILEVGGNAMDAAIAASLVVGVVNSFSSGIGGGGFMLLRKKTPGGDVFDSFDFRETAPSSLTSEAFLGNTEAATVGGLAVGVPGEVMGYYEAHKEYGKLPWKMLFEDAIRLANGFKATSILVKKLVKNEVYIKNDPGLREIFTKNGKLVEEGDIIKRTGLSKTLLEISNDPMSFYKGKIAAQIVKFLNINGGVFSTEDLQNYAIKKRSVIEGHFYDFKVYTTNLPTAGLFIVQALKILERINVRDLMKIGIPGNSHYFYHILIEVLKHISEDRGRFGDPDFQPGWEKKVSALISDAKATKIFKKFNIESASKPEKYRKNPFYKEDNGTSHLNIIDADEMLVSITTTVNLEFGAKILDPVTGIIFNNEIDDFYIPTIDETHDRQKTQANALKGGKRPFSSIAPTFMIGNDETIVIGATGGARIPSAIISTILYLMAGNELAKSVESCRIHNRQFPVVTLIEPMLPDEIVNKLREMGHRMEISEMNTTFSSVQAVYLKNLGNGKKEIIAVSDRRKHGESAGR